ncbi:hypothetical protein KI688_000679 [Linnemannia hyalina]|uniref:Uncharacterized protein n=1 Tax=Linnemannia hyalina TaxID=64524 RepID=A0A9P7Y6K2_9FUNG|nr:hypothetical protein KI688_000679 [Linnemannia hyalina]
MDQLQNTITTLNLFGSKMCGVDDVLHQYLCSSPHLQHLRAPDTIYLCKPTRDLAMSQIAIFHMGFHTLDQVTSAFSTPQHAQILFGYISFVCPNLEDLFIHGTEGLETSWSGARTGAVLVDKVEVFKSVEGGEGVDADVESDNNSNNNSTNHNSDRNVPTGAKPGSETRVEDEADTKLKEALKDLGKFTDVKNAIEGMDAAEGFISWPEIRKMAIFSEDPFDLPVEREYQRIISRQ